MGAFLLTVALLVTGCDGTRLQTAGNGGNRRGIDSMKRTTPLGPGQFVWEGQTIRRSGESTVPSPGMPTSDLLARAEARRSALRAREEAVRELPVNDRVRVGQAMDRSVSLSLAISRIIQRARTIPEATTRQPDGRMAVTLELPTEELAEALRAHKVTPEGGLPSQPVLPETRVPGAPVV
jgi:hypothetical protein